MTAPLHATPIEVALWRTRTTQVPYDVHWQRVQVRAEAFLANPTTALWLGNQLTVPWWAPAVLAKTQEPNRHPGRKRGDGLRDAALLALLTGATSTRDVVQNALLAQVVQPGTDFGNPSKWDQRSGLDSHNFEIVNWIRKLAYGYSYVRGMMDPATHDVIASWFSRAASYWASRLAGPIRSRFPKREEGIYDQPDPTKYPGSVKGKTHWDGWTVTKFHEAWFNIPAACAAMVGVVGVLLADATLMGAARRFVQEWLMCNVAPDGTLTDQFRWNDSLNPHTGFGYAGTALGSLVTIADHLGRAGDTSLYDYETSSGYFGWEGGPKSLQLVTNRYARLVLGERDMGDGVNAYASKDGVLTPEKRLGPGDDTVTDVVLLPAQLYYRDPVVARVLHRVLPSSPTSGGYDPWGGDWGCYPALRFMYADLTGTVWPYPATTARAAV
jgi:hypothetical protein